MASKAIEDTDLTFFNVIKYVIPERRLKKSQNSQGYVIRYKEKNIPMTEHAIYHEDEKEIPKLELPIVSHKAIRETPKTFQSQETVKASRKKITNFAKYKQQQKDGQEHDQQGLKSIQKSEKLNLGLKKKGGKGKMKEYMMSILARTKIDQEVTIKRSAFQSNEKTSARVSSLDQKNNAEEREGDGNRAGQKKTFSHNKIKPLKHLKTRIDADSNKRQDIKLPNVHEHKSILQMVKKDEKRRQKDHEKSKFTIRKIETQMKEIQNEVIPQELEYSTLKQQQSQKIEQSIKQVIYN